MRTLWITILVCLFGGQVLATDTGLVTGLEMKNPRQVGDMLVTGGQPSAEDLVRLRERGVTTVINLRGEGEVTHHDDPKIAERFNYPEAEVVTSFGLKYVHIPIATKDDLTQANAELLAAALAANDGKTLLHCGSGNRVGALMALKAFYVDGADAEAAVAAGLEAGLTGLEPRVREILGNTPEE